MEFYKAKHKTWKGQFTLNDDGTFIGGGGNRGDGKWKKEGDKIIIDWFYWGTQTLTLGDDGIYRDDTLKLKPCKVNKIFCIGMHRTATRSLCDALGILGYPALHYRGIREHFHDMVGGDFSFIKRNKRIYSYADIPIPYFFKELDKAYPGSKFILGLRSTESWIKSLTRHMREMRPHQKKPLDRDIHKYFYGIDLDDYSNPDMRMALYEEHNDTVREYFKDRPDDLLEYRLIEGDGWEPLCKFLGEDIPDRKFPAKGTK
jgi:hypothetical protein